METVFEGECFYRNEETYPQKKKKFKPEMGFIRLSSDELNFQGEKSYLLIPIESIKKILLIKENIPLRELAIISLIDLILITIIFVIYNPLELFVRDLLLISILVFFNYLFYTIFTNRTWILVIYQVDSIEQTSYFSFDWRKNPIFLPWKRPNKLWLWLVKRSDNFSFFKLLKRTYEHYAKE